MPRTKSGQRQRICGQVLATLPGAQGPQCSPLSLLFFGHSGLTLTGFISPCHGLYSMRQFLAKEKWTEQTLSLV